MRIVLLLLVAVSLHAQNLIKPLAAVQAEIKGKLERITVHGKSLEGNLEGDSPDRDVFVYLPPSYGSEPNRRYPVVYTLHGFGLHATQWVGFADVSALERGMAAGTTKEMILVAPDAFTLYTGSFYSNSAATGDWETFLGVELVRYIDSHYRTVADRASRGLAGHSMGGYGTMRLAMKHPEVFSSLFSMSAGGVLETGELSPEILASIAGVKTREEASKIPSNQRSAFARAAAWSANPAKAPLFLDWPSGSDSPIRDKWRANSLLSIIQEHAAELKTMKAIRMNVGDKDNLMASNKEMDAALTKAGVAHKFDIFPGDHNGQVPMNFEKEVLPFFSQQLAFPK